MVISVSNFSIPTENIDKWVERGVGWNEDYMLDGQIGLWAGRKDIVDSLFIIIIGNIFMICFICHPIYGLVAINPNWPSQLSSDNNHFWFIP